MTAVSKASEMENVSEKLVKICQAVLAWLVFVILCPVLLLFLGSLFIWKYGLLWLIVKLFKRKFIGYLDDSEGLFAVDRYWESSRSSLALIVELEGSINVDEFRDEFRKNVLDYPSDTPSESSGQQNGDAAANEKPFAKLTQIPSTFCGYYFWQKANYFLIHEHIRQINQPTDELGLRKAVGTLMTLPFPNRRPLWEILVYSNYLGTSTVGRGGTTCASVLFIRIHRSVTDSQGLLNILRQMLMTESERATLRVSSVQMSGSGNDPPQTKKESEAESGNFFVYSRNLLRDQLTNAVHLPLRSFQYAQSVVKTPEGIVSCTQESSQGSNDAAYAAWTNLSEILIWKTCATQSPKLTRSAVELSLFLEGLSSRGKRHRCYNVPEEKGIPTHQGKCQTSVLIPLNHAKVSHSHEFVPGELLSNRACFSSVKCPCIATSILQSGGSKANFLKTINVQVEKTQPDHAKIVKIYMWTLGLLPRHLLRYLLMNFRWGAGYLVYEQFQMDYPRGQLDDPRLFGRYVVSQVVPLVGLQWTHTAASAATLKWQDRPNVVMSVMANPSIIGPLSQGNPQDQVERIVRGIPEELERLGDDEDHGFVSIPIS